MERFGILEATRHKTTANVALLSISVGEVHLTGWAERRMWLVEVETPPPSGNEETNGF